MVTNIWHCGNCTSTARLASVARMSAATSGATAPNPAYRCAHPGCIRLFRPLSEIPTAFADISGPVIRQQALSHTPVKRRMRPIAHARYESVLDRIEVDVIDMPREVALVADGVLPEPPLPKRQIAVRPPLQLGPAID